MKKYAIFATYEPPDEEASEIEVRIWFTFTPGSPDTYDASRGGPGGWDPGYPPEVEFDSVERLDATPVPELDDWAREYLRGSGFDAAVEEAADDGPDPDAAYDRDRDDREHAGRYFADQAGEE